MLRSLPVLMYHSISRFEHRLCVSPELFDDHCRVLNRAGWRGISLQEAEEYFLRKKRLPRKTLLFTFDDGYLDNFVNAEPILQAHNHQGVLFPVIGLMETKAIIRQAPQVHNETGTTDIPDLDTRKPIRRSTGYRVSPIIFSSWEELKVMQQRGVMGLAPHSMRHHRVVTELTFSNVYSPNRHFSFFDVAPEKAVWGMPRFKLGHGLARRGYIIAPELYELINSMVPQENDKAQAFLSDKKNFQKVITAINQLPSLGRLESEDEYRKRLREEFIQCREAFQQRLGITPISFCWPWGSYNDIALEEAKKVGFRVFFATMRGMNYYGRPNAVCRIAVRGGSGEELLKTVQNASSTLRELPFQLYKWGKGVKEKFLKTR